MKKFIILTLVTLTFAVTVNAQQVPMFSHYYFNKFLYNPALTGSESFGQAYLVYRNQWNSIPGAPKTKAFTLDGPLRNNKVGLGVSLFQDNAGQFNSTGGKLSYRYGLQLNKESKLNFGLALGFLDNRIDFNKLDPKHPLDPVILSQYDSETGFDATFGVNYIYKKLEIGLSVPQVLANELSYESIGNISAQDPVYGLVRHFIATAKYDFELSDKLSFEPIAMVRATPGTPVQYDVNAMFNYDDRFWLGGMYRSKYSATISGAARLFNQVVAGYSYDIAVNKSYKKYMVGAHEVMLGYQFGIQDKEARKMIKLLDGKVKKNTDDIKTNRGDIDDNDKDIEDKDKEIDDLEKDNDDLEKEVEQLRKEFDEFKKSLESGSLQKGESFAFNNVYFNTNSSSIGDVNNAELENLATILKSNGSMTISIIGHTDPRGSSSFNESLSRRRASSVRNYLINAGIDASRLQIGARGESEQVSNELSPNRRVEFTVLSM